MTIGCTKAGQGAVRIDLAVVKVPFKRERERKKEWSYAGLLEDRQLPVQ